MTYVTPWPGWQITFLFFFKLGLYRKDREFGFLWCFLFSNLLKNCEKEFPPKRWTVNYEVQRHTWYKNRAPVLQIQGKCDFHLGCLWLLKLSKVILSPLCLTASCVLYWLVPALHWSYSFWCLHWVKYSNPGPKTVLTIITITQFYRVAMSGVMSGAPGSESKNPIHFSHGQC